MSWETFERKCDFASSHTWTEFDPSLLDDLINVSIQILEAISEEVKTCSYKVGNIVFLGEQTSNGFHLQICRDETSVPSAKTSKKSRSEDIVLGTLQTQPALFAFFSTLMKMSLTTYGFTRSEQVNLNMFFHAFNQSPVGSIQSVFENWDSSGVSVPEKFLEKLFPSMPDREQFHLIVSLQLNRVSKLMQLYSYLNAHKRQ